MAAKPVTLGLGKDTPAGGKGEVWGGKCSETFIPTGEGRKGILSPLEEGGITEPSLTALSGTRCPAKSVHKNSREEADPLPPLNPKTDRCQVRAAASAALHALWTALWTAGACTSSSITSFFHCRR